MTALIWGVTLNQPLSPGVGFRCQDNEVARRVRKVVLINRGNELVTKVLMFDPPYDRGKSDWAGFLHSGQEERLRRLRPSLPAAEQPIGPLAGI